MDFKAIIRLISEKEGISYEEAEKVFDKTMSEYLEGKGRCIINGCPYRKSH